ncbi:E2F transcription factor 5 [Phyllostomus discolor]|uniref:E2F transcription factor 5 n=1 Tax=Phyllostomus discolor TaxID=89673 RepID=A0A833ZMH6_9CHIR|nr:E2F transcription factor 5 [Phyllostomus discolor]
MPCRNPCLSLGCKPECSDSKIYLVATVFLDRWYFLQCENLYFFFLTGDTLLAIQAPSGTQLEVPIPEMGQNGQKKYQINLKSHSGPIHVLLINKESSSSQPVVFPVPPPDDLTQPSSRPSTPRTSHKPSPATRRPPEQPTPEKDQGSQHMPATDLASGSISGDIIDELMSSDVFPLLRLSPTPADDYNFNLDDNEGVCDLFDVQILNY